MHPRYLSNAFVVGESRGGAAVFVDSGAPISPLLQFVSTHSLRLTHLLRTHAHADHIFGLDDVRRFNEMQGGELPVFARPQTLEDLRRALPDPGRPA